MKGIEFLKINKNGLELMSKHDLRVSDYLHIPMYEEYLSMRCQGDKVSYILASLAERYGLSESSVKRIVRRFSGEVKL